MPSEKSVEAALVAEAKALGIVSFKLQGGHDGDPDRIFIRGSRCVLMEIKQPDGRLSEIQRHRIKWLASRGLTVGVVWSLGEGRFVLHRMMTEDDFGDWIH